MNDQSLDSVAENWYARLNRLKDRYSAGGLTPNKEEQLKKLIAIMILRMTRLTPHYIEASKPAMVNFQPGGIEL